MVENTTPAVYSKPKVYIGDPWYPAVDGKLKNLEFSSTKGNNRVVAFRALS